MLRLSENPGSRWPADRALIDDLGQWWVARVKPRNEKALAWELARLGVGYYLPMIKKRTIRRDNGKPRKSVLCLFPGYVPVVGYQDKKADILRSGRIVKVIRVIDQERFVMELENVRRVLEQEMELGLYPHLAVGLRVKIASGPLRGLEGLVIDIDQPDKIFLNVEMFNRAVTVRVLPEQLVPVEDQH
jgi:transcription antitermination factor NusG